MSGSLKKNPLGNTTPSTLPTHPSHRTHFEQTLLHNSILLKIRKNPDKIADLGSRGSGGPISIVNIIKRIAQKLRRIILLRFGQVTFRIHFGKAPKPFIFMIVGLGGRVRDSQNQYYFSLENREAPNNSRNFSTFPIFLQISACWKSAVLKTL